MDDDPRVTAADEAVIRAATTGEGLIPLESMEQIEALARAAGETMAAFRAQVAAMTREQAEFVRRLRVEQEYTWRAVAATCALEWGGDWGSNQLAGMAICERAALFFGEDYRGGPWNDDEGW